MKTKAEVEALLQETKALSTRVTDAEGKVKQMEQERVNDIARGSFGRAIGASAGSDEQRALRTFGCSHVKDLLTVNTGLPRWKGVSPELKQVVRELKASVDTARFIAQAFHGGARDQVKPDGEEIISSVKGIADTYFAKNELVPRLKSFGSTVSGAGADWVPTAISSQYVHEYELEHLLEQKFRAINMPTNPFKMSVQKGITKARKATENTQMTDNNFGTTTIVFNAVKLAEFYLLPEELTEDSAVDILPIARDEVTRAQVRARETGFLNGDTTSPHLDSDTQAAGSDVAEKQFNGLRELALANAAHNGTANASNAALTDTFLRAMRAGMGKYGVNPKELMWIVGPQVYTQMLTLPSTITVEKYGPMAAVLQGALAAYMGIPIYVAEYLREDLNASGVYDGTTTNRGSIILCNTQRFYVGNRRPIRVRLMEDLPWQDRWQLASYSRVDFQGHVQSATETSVVYGYNVAVP